MSSCPFLGEFIDRIDDLTARVEKLEATKKDPAIPMASFVLQFEKKVMERLKKFPHEMVPEDWVKIFGYDNEPALALYKRYQASLKSFHVSHKELKEQIMSDGPLVRYKNLNEVVDSIKLTVKRDIYVENWLQFIHMCHSTGFLA